MKNRLKSLVFAAACVSLACAVACHERHSVPEKPPARIVSLSPGITEILFALGLGDRVIGVTSYCNYPPEAARIERIGGYSDANLEKIIVLRPDLVVLSREHEKQRIYLDRFHVRTLCVDHSTCGSLCSSFAAIGRVCGAKRAADSMVGLFGAALVGRGRSSEAPARLLFCVGRDSPGSGRVQNVFAAGKATFYNDLIEAAGGENALTDSLPEYPKLSFEGILALAPDVIIDATPAMGSPACSLLVRDWQTMTRVPAVRRHHVYCMSNEYVTVPGPRLLLLLADIKRIVETAGEGGSR